MDSTDSRVLLERVATEVQMYVKSNDRIIAELQHANKNFQHSINTVGDKIDKAVSRIHERIDVDFTKAYNHAQTAHDEIKQEKIKLLTALVVWFLSAVGIAWKIKGGV